MPMTMRMMSMLATPTMSSKKLYDTKTTVLFYELIDFLFLSKN